VTKKPPPDPPAALWYLVTKARTVGRFTTRPGWYRVNSGTRPEMDAALQRHQAFTPGAVLAITERGEGKRCPEPPFPDLDATAW
jgi:hypothetical protein